MNKDREFFSSLTFCTDHGRGGTVITVTGDSFCQFVLTIRSASTKASRNGALWTMRVPPLKLLIQAAMGAAQSGKESCWLEELSLILRLSGNRNRRSSRKDHLQIELLNNSFLIRVKIPKINAFLYSGSIN